MKKTTNQNLRLCRDLHSSIPNSLAKIALSIKFPRRVLNRLARA